MVSWLPYAVGGVFAVIGVVLVLQGRRQRQAAAAAQQWPAVTGTILSSRVGSTERRDKDGRMEYRYKTVISYEYTVGERTFTGTRIDLGWAGSEGTFAGPHEELVRRYPAGRQVPVYYDPDKPNECTLERTSSGAALQYVFGGFLLAVGLVVIVVGLQSDFGPRGPTPE